MVGSASISRNTPLAHQPIAAPTDNHPVTLIVSITGDNYQWLIHYPGRDGRLHTPDDIVKVKDLHLPERTPVLIQLQSKDYIYTFALPHLRLKQMAVPDMTFSVKFKTESIGTFDLLGDELCGYSHPSLMGKLVVESRDGFYAWLNQPRS